MAQQTGSLYVDLSANSAGFDRDMGKATASLNSAQARMNALLGKMEQGFRGVSQTTTDLGTKLGAMTLKGGAALLGIQSLGSVVRGTMAVMRDMDAAGAKLGVTVDRDVALSAKTASNAIDILAFNIKTKLASALVLLAPMIPGFGAAMRAAQAGVTGGPAAELQVKIAAAEAKLNAARSQAALPEGGLIGRSRQRSVKAAEEELARLQAQYAEVVDATTDFGRVLIGVRLDIDKSLKAEGDANEKEYADHGRALAGIALTIAESRKAGDKLAQDHADAIFEAAAAFQFERDNMRATSTQLEINTTLRRLGVDATSAEGKALAEVITLRDQEREALDKSNKATEDSERAFAAMQKRLQDAISKRVDDTQEAWDRFKESSASALDDALMRTHSLSEGLRALATEVARSFLHKQVTGPIVDFISSGMGQLFGGARAGGGPVASGTSYLVGENGPEIFSPSASGTIIPNGGGGGAPTINIDARGADAGVLQRIQAAMAHMYATVPQRAVAAVAAANRRTFR